MTDPEGRAKPEDAHVPDPADAPPPATAGARTPPPAPAAGTKASAESATAAGVPPVVAQPIVVRTPWHKRWTTRALAALIILPLMIFAVWAAVTLNVKYERGERYGYVQNFAKQGVICSTWEGELAMTNVPGVAPQIFRFSVRNDEVAADIQQSIGKRVALAYAEHRNVPTSCFGKSDYFVSAVRVEEP